MTRALVALTAAAVLAGCSNSPSEITTVDALAEAVGCEARSVGAQQGTSGAGVCGDLALAVFDTVEQRDQWVALLDAFGGQPTAVGQVWAVSGPDAARVREAADKAGGTMVQASVSR